MSFSFQMKIVLCKFHIYKNTTWENVNIGQEISVQLEKNEDPKKIDPYCCAIKTMVSGKRETVGHTPTEVSSHTYFYIKVGGCIDRSVLSTCHHPSPIPSGGPEIPLKTTFRSSKYITHQKMKDFMPKLYSYDHNPDTDNVESDSDSDEFHIKVKENVVEEGQDSKVVVAPKAKKRKVTIAHTIAMILMSRKKRCKRKLPLKMTVMTQSQRISQN